MSDMGTTDAMFDYIVVCEETLDDVIEKLAACGVEVEPGKRGVVQRWLDVFDQRLPMRLRLMVLRGWLKTGR